MLLKIPLTVLSPYVSRLVAKLLKMLKVLKVLTIYANV